MSSLVCHSAQLTLAKLLHQCNNMISACLLVYLLNGSVRTNLVSSPTSTPPPHNVSDVASDMKSHFALNLHYIS